MSELDIRYPHGQFQRVDAFFQFMMNRELIRLRRQDGLPRDKWTDDPIFQEYSFTNVKRKHDRTTVLFYDEFYSKFGNVPHPNPEVLLNAAIFRLTGKIETIRKIKWTRAYTFNQKEFVDKVDTILNPFTSAYVIPNCGRQEPKSVVVAEIIDGIYKNATDILATNSWECASERLCQSYGIGSFMSKEILLDYILATHWMPSDWKTWTPVGPGARLGSGYIVHGQIQSISEHSALSLIRKLYEDLNQFWPKSVHTDGWYELPELDITDIQFQLCEFAKYMKAKLGVGRPKRRFKPTTDYVTNAKVES